jgi:hypothetical protein
MNQSRSARCLNCRSDVPVPDSYADGSQISCGACAVHLRIIRTGGLRLVIADVAPFREMLKERKLLVAETTRDLQKARASWGIGVNGLGVGVLYIVARIALEERVLEQGLIIEAVVISVLVGIVLEVANTLFLSKRQAVSRLTLQLQEALADQKDIERKIRESSRR